MNSSLPRRTHQEAGDAARLLCAAALALSALCAPPARAEIPAPYQPIVVEAPFSFTKRVFDLTDAVERSKQENKPLYVVLGAKDCGPCKLYQKFLQDNHEQLAPGFSRVLVVDIRTWLTGPALSFRIGDNNYTVAEFKALVGDRNKSLSYPAFWLLSPELRQLKQLPQGSQHYTTVAKQLDVLAVP
jgi:hypothetical protein